MSIQRPTNCRHSRVCHPSRVAVHYIVSAKNPLDPNHSDDRTAHRFGCCGELRMRYECSGWPRAFRSASCHPGGPRVAREADIRPVRLNPFTPPKSASLVCGLPSILRGSGRER